MVKKICDFTSVCLFNVIFFGGLLLWTFLYLPSALLIFVFHVHIQRKPRQKEIRALVHFYGRVCCLLIGTLTKFDCENENKELPKSYIVTANHQSFFDPYCIGFFPIQNQVFFVRGWPFRIPLYGFIMREAGYLNSEHMNVEEFFRKAGDLLRKDSVLVIYPEGTRSATGKLGRFRSGAFRLAIQYSVPIVPMCIDGTGTVFPKGKFFGKPAPVRVMLLKQVNPENFRSFGDTAHLHLQRHVKGVMEEALTHHS